MPVVTICADLVEDDAVSFGLDFVGRLRKVKAPVSTSNRALYEAVANSFDSTSSLKDKGRITVRILRKPDDTSVFKGTDAQSYILEGYEIEDNGIGFTDDNLRYFKESDTRNKPSGKGVGRLLWLHVFDWAEVTSIYDQDGSQWERSFTFSEANNGINDAETKPTKLTNRKATQTKVRLLRPKSNRIAALATDVKSLASHLLEHFLLFFTALKGPSLVVIDSVTSETQDVGNLFKEVIGDRHSEEPFNVKGLAFVLHHLMVKPTTTRKNTVNLCANRRVVTTELVSSLIQDVGNATAVTVDKSLRYQAYITGDYLDEIADDERTGLKFLADTEPEEEEPETSLLTEIPPMPVVQDQGITKSELFEKIADLIRMKLNTHLEGVRRQKEEKLEKFAQQDQPQFRPYLERAKQHLGRLKARPNQKAIELALYEARIDGRTEMNNLIDRIITESPAHEQVEDARKRLVEDFTKEANRANVYALAEYVCLRKAVISVLKALQQKKDGDADKNNVYESVIHNLFFPRFQTSDRIPASHASETRREIAHLWLLDERLVFHRLLASDVPPSKIRGFLSNDDNSTDIVVFDPAFSASDDLADLGSISIIEFKRPGRNNYGLAQKRIP